MNKTTPDVSENNLQPEETVNEQPKNDKPTFKQKLARAIAKKMRKLMDEPEKPEGSENSAPKKPKENKSKPKDAKKTAKRLFGYMMKSKALIVLVIILVVSSAAFSVASTAINEPIVNLCQSVLNINTRPDRGEFIQELALWLGLMMGLSIVSALASYGYSRIMLQISQRTMRIIRKDLFDHIEKLPIKYFDTHKKGDIMSRFTSDVSTINNIVNEGLTTLLSSGVTLIGTVAMMCIYSFRITIILFLSLIVMVIVVLVLGVLSAKQFKKYQKAMGECNAYIEEYIGGQRVVKLFSYEETSKENFSGLVVHLKKVGIGANTITGLMMPIMTFITRINYAICALLGASMIITSGGTAMNTGRLVAYLSYAKSFSSPVTSLASQFTSLMSALAGAERIFEIIDMPPEIDEGNVKLVKVIRDQNGEYMECDDYGWVYAWKVPLAEGQYVYTEVKGEVEFRNVSFGYEEDTPVLKNISISAKANEKIAFVGSTGAGKTTVTNLINRFYDIQEGTITIDGVDIKAIEKNSLRGALSIVLQDTHLFTGTVADNIRYGRLDATDDEVVEAAKIANAHSFISRLPQGYQTEITGDGGNLSQGQRQLLAIARAAVANPAVLILDEATSSIDTRTEKLIEKGMDKLMENRTVFVIAHRLSTVRNSDQIMVLEHGEIIEEGNHDTLIEQQGKYYQLYNGLYELE